MRQTCSTYTVISENAERFAMDVVRSGLRYDVNCTGGRELVGKIQARLCNREFLNRARGYVHCGRTYRFVGDVDSVDFDSRCTSEPSTERDGRVADLRGIEVRSI